MQKNIQIPLELFDDLVILIQGLNDGCDINSPLFTQLIDRISAGICEKRKSIGLRKLYQESLANNRANPGCDTFQNYRDTKRLWKLF